MDGRQAITKAHLAFVQRWSHWSTEDS